MSGGIRIAEDGTIGAGRTVDDLATQARTRLAPLYTSAQPASTGNPGFASGPQAVTFVQDMSTAMSRSLDELAALGDSITASATSTAGQDAQSAEALSRVRGSLDGVNPK